MEFQPTLPARGATVPDDGGKSSRTISTHAPRTGSDPAKESSSNLYKVFQPTLPARGATCRMTADDDHAIRFQPTLPARGATQEAFDAYKQQVDFNPRSPHGERRWKS